MLKTNPQSLAGLTTAQLKLHGNCDAALAEGLILDKDELVGVETTLEVLESLAACRALLKKHEWIALPTGYYCHECGNEKNVGHAPDCAIAAELEGTEGE